MFWVLILVIIFLWIIFAFAIPILTFPRMPIINFSLPVHLSPELQKEIKKLKKIKDKKQVIIATLNYIKKNFESNSLLLFIQLHKHYYKKASAILQKKGFWPCHIQVFILRLLLIKSRKFEQDDIQVHYTFYNGIIHEYLKIRVNNKWIIRADPWGYNKGVPFGYQSMGPFIDWFRFKVMKKMA